LYNETTQGYRKSFEKRLKKGDEWSSVVNDFTVNLGQQFTREIPQFLHIAAIRILLRVAMKFCFIAKKSNYLVKTMI
jgi:hypothetical protein